MSFAPTPAIAGYDFTQPDAMPSSLQTPALTSANSDPARLRLQAERDERALLRSVHSLLNPAHFPSLSFVEMKAKEAAFDVSYLGKIGGDIWYLPNGVTRQQITDAAQLVSEPPAERPSVRAALYMLWLTTKHEKMDVQDRNDLMAVLLTNLAPFPEQAILAALAKLSSEARFFPAWADNLAELTPLCGWRGQLIAALRHFLQRRKDLP